MITPLKKERVQKKIFSENRAVAELLKNKTRNYVNEMLHHRKETTVGCSKEEKVIKVV